MEHARKELDLLYASEPDVFVKEFDAEIMAIVKKFDQSGQSGGSAPFNAAIISETIRKLLQRIPLSPLTGNDDEWNDISEDTEVLYQNNRNSAVFKHGNKAHFLDAVIFVDEQETGWNGSAWLSQKDFETGNTNLQIHSRGFIKSFPFNPKSFYIDVITILYNNGDCDHIVKNPDQLKPVFEYYDYTAIPYLSNFKQWADNFFSPERLNTMLVSHEAMADYSEFTKDKGMSPKQWKMKLDMYCNLKGWKLNPERVACSNGRILKRVNGKIREMIYIQTKQP